eukprot:1180359-Prorocentrum_minimum.AAC.2
MKRRSPVRHSPARQLARACQSLPEVSMLRLYSRAVARWSRARPRRAHTHTHTCITSSSTLVRDSRGDGS